MGQGMEVENQKFYFYFLNSDSSFNNLTIIINFLLNNLKTLSEGSVSQNCNLGSRFFFMLCRNFFNLIFQYFLRFIA